MAAHTLEAAQNAVFTSQDFKIMFGHSWTLCKKGWNLNYMGFFHSVKLQTG